jgi:hypothetical protein
MLPRLCTRASGHITIAADHATKFALAAQPLRICRTPQATKATPNSTARGRMPKAAQNGAEHRSRTTRTASGAVRVAQVSPVGLDQPPRRPSTEAPAPPQRRSGGRLSRLWSTRARDRYSGRGEENTSAAAGSRPPPTAVEHGGADDPSAKREVVERRRAARAPRTRATASRGCASGAPSCRRERGTTPGREQAEAPITITASTRIRRPRRSPVDRQDHHARGRCTA